MKQWQRTPLPQRYRIASRMKAMQETREELTSTNVKIEGSTCIAGITCTPSPPAYDVNDRSATRHDLAKTIAQTLSRDIWQRKNFYRKSRTERRARKSEDVLRESRDLIRD